MFQVAPITPDWGYSAGVPKVIVPERITPACKVRKPTYPYYFDPLLWTSCTIRRQLPATCSP
ncbi:MAG: hypothetical protein RL077_635 [Verrucomicrobiota bacterium]|jgi:hypothetical protein